MKQPIQTTLVGTQKQEFDKSWSQGYGREIKEVPLNKCKPKAFENF